MVPKSLRVWFVIHFVLDIAVAVPLLVATDFTLSLFGWTTIDPFAARLVAAALMGIGGESLLGRNASAETYRAMLNLKIIWSVAAIFGIILTLIFNDGPLMAYVVLLLFAVFSGLWMYYRFLLR